MRLAGSGRSEQHHVAWFEQEPARGKGRDLLADGRLGVPVEVLKRFAALKPAARIRSSAPDAFRALTSRSRTAARSSSNDQPASRA
jgi:hypothetical protein